MTGKCGKLQTFTFLALQFLQPFLDFLCALFGCGSDVGGDPMCSIFAHCLFWPAPLGDCLYQEAMFLSQIADLTTFQLIERYKDAISDSSTGSLS